MATYPAFESQFTSTLKPGPGTPQPAADPAADRLALAEQLLEIAERAQSFTGSSGAVIAVRRGDEMIVRTSSGTAPEVGARFTLDDSVIGLCVRTGKPQDSANDGDGVKNPLLAALNLRSAAAVPVRCGTSIRAALAVFSTMPSAFSRTHLAILMTLRDVIGAKLENTPWPLNSAQAEAVARVSEKFAAPQPMPAAPVAAPKPARADVPPLPVIRTDIKVVLSPLTPIGAKAKADLPAVSEQPAPKVAAASPVVPPPAPTSNVAELMKLVDTPPAPPVQPAPGLLAPGEDPGKYHREPVMAAAAQPVPVLPQVLITPPVPRVAEAVTPTAELSLFSKPEESRRGLGKILAVVAGLIVLTAALGLYWGRSGTATASKPPQLIAVPVSSSPEAPPVASMTVTAEVAPAPKPAATTKSADKAQPEGAVQPVHEKPAAKAEAATPIALAPAAPKAAPEAAPEAPSLAFAAGRGMPELPSVKAPTASLAARHAVVVPAALTESKPPVYPEMARRLGIQGAVKMQLTINADGSIKSVQVLSGEPLLREASVSAVRQWRYHPATLDGRAVESTADVVLTFKGQR